MRSSGQRRQRIGFDFTAHMRFLCADIVGRLPQLRHVDLNLVGIAFSQTRKNVTHGMYASLTPMRFEGGARSQVRARQRHVVQPVLDARGNELLYILRFYLPRFMNVGFEEKLITILHELWHISPTFNGDLRRHPGRYYMHTQSEREYDAQMARLAAQWLAAKPPLALYAFLGSDFDKLQRRHGRVFGTTFTQPRVEAHDAK